MRKISPVIPGILFVSTLCGLGLGDRAVSGGNIRGEHGSPGITFQNSPDLRSTAELQIIEKLAEFSHSIGSASYYGLNRRGTSGRKLKRSIPQQIGPDRHQKIPKELPDNVWEVPSEIGSASVPAPATYNLNPDNTAWNLPDNSPESQRPLKPMKHPVVPRSGRNDPYQKPCVADQDCVNQDYFRCFSNKTAQPTCICLKEMERARITSGKYKGTVWCLVKDGYTCTDKETRDEDCVHGKCDVRNKCDRHYYGSKATTFRRDTWLMPSAVTICIFLCTAH